MQPLRIAFALALLLPAQAAQADTSDLSICEGPNRAERKVTCLVDGDTGWENGVKWRLEGIDTPEYAAHAECAAEVELAHAATSRMLELMSGGYEIDWLHERGYYDRDLIRVTLSDGRDAGTVLKEDGLAVSWPHEPGVFCQPE